MRKKFAKKIFALLLTAIMLFSTYIPIAAATVTSPNNEATDDEIYYSIAYENGKLKVKINPEKIYEIIQDRQLTRDELIKFVPEDVLELIKNRDELSSDDLTTILSSYISTDDLLKIVEDIPEKLRASIIDIKLLENIITVNELLAAIPMDEIIAAVEFEYVEALLNNEALGIMISDDVINDILKDNPNFINFLIDNTTIVDDALKDENTKNALFALLDEEMIKDILKTYPEVKDKLFTDTVLSGIMDEISSDTKKLDTLATYITSNETALKNFVSDPTVAKAIINLPAAKTAILTADNLSKLIKNGVITKDMIYNSKDTTKGLLTPDQIKSLVNGDVINKLLGDDNFIESILGSDLLGKIIGDNIEKLVELNSVKAEFENLDISKIKTLLAGLTIETLEAAGASVDLSKITYDYLSGKGITYDTLISEGVIDLSNLDANALYDDEIIKDSDISDIIIIPDDQNTAKNKIKDILVDKIDSGNDKLTSDYIIDNGLINKEKLIEGLVGNNTLTPADIITYGIDVNNPDSVDPATMKQIASDKNLEASDIANIDGVIAVDTLDKDLVKKFFDDGVITFSDLKGNGFLYNAKIEEIVKDKVTNGDITFDDLDDYGIVIDVTPDFISKYPDITIESLMEEGIIAVEDKTKVITYLVENNHISAEKVRTAIGDEKIKEIISNEEDAKKVFTDYFKSDKISFEEYWPLIDLTSLVDKINMDTVVGYAKEEETYDKMVDLLSNGNKIKDAIEALGSDTIQGIVKGEGNLSSLFKTAGVLNTFFTYFSRDALVEELGGYAALAKEYKDVIGVGALDTIATTVGGYGELAKRFDTKELLDAIGGASTVTKYVKDDLEPIITELGGFEKLLSYYSEEEISKIIETIGYKNIINFVKDSGLAEKVDLKAIGSDILDLVKSKDEGFKTLGKEIKNRLYKFLMTDVESLSLNGTEIFSAGKFDLNAILATTAKAIPDVEDFISIGVDGMIASFVLEAEIEGEKYPFGIESSWHGDPSELNAFVEGYKEYFKFDVSDDLDVTFSAIAPSTLSDIYETVLTSDKVPSTLKEALLTLPAGDVNGVISFLKDLDESEIKAIHEAVAPKIDTISDKAYAAIDKIDTISAPAADKLKAGVDQIVDAFSSTEKLESFIDNTVNKIDNKIPSGLKNRKLMEFYAGDGSFELEKSFEVDLYERINSVISLPKEIKVLFTDNDMTIRGSVDTAFSLGDIYKLRLITETDEPMDIFLPAGITLHDVLKNVPTLADDLPKGIYDLDLNDAISMPKGDTTLYSTEVYEVTFPDGTSVRYPNGATKEDLLTKEPPLPTARPGYTNSWDYTIGVSGSTTATLVETPNNYTVTYVDKNDDPIIVDGNPCTYTYTFDTAGLATIILENAPKLKGHDASISGFDPDNPNDQNVKVTYTAIEYELTYKTQDGSIEGSFKYTYGATEQEIQNKILQSLNGADNGYTVSFSKFDAELDGDQEIIITLNANSYKVIYVDELGSSLNADYTFTYGTLTEDIIEENTPKKDGYTATLEYGDITIPGDITVKVTYTANRYKVTYVDPQNNPIIGEDGEPCTYEYAYGTDGLADLVLQNAPQLKGHTAHISGFDPDAAENQSVTVTHTANEYELTYKTEDGSIDGSFTYTYGATEQDIQGEILSRITVPDGYDVCFSAFDADLDSDQEIIITFTAKTYKFTFTDADEKEIYTFDFVFGTLTDNLVRSKIPVKTGHSADISNYDVTVAGDISVVLTYVPNKYKVTFMAEDKTTIIDEVTFTYGDKALSKTPNVPEKLGYTGKWGDYALGDKNITVYPEYTVIKYTARFLYEDGTVYKEFIFTVETTALEEPPVPSKEGYTGKWENYTLGTSDITIRPIYTPIAVDEPDTPDTPDSPDSPDSPDAPDTHTPPTDDGDQQKPVGCKGAIWWIIVAILFIIIVILVLLYILREKIFDNENDDDNTPPTTPDPAPESEAEEDATEEEAVAPHFDVMEDVTPESADQFMTDEEALATVETVSAADSSDRKKQTNEGYKTFVNLEDISAVFAPGDTVDLASLKAHGLIPQKTVKVKVLAKGHLDKPLTVVANKFSVQAIKMIVLTGGKAIITK
ncbi:MAG: uL15 family ribosomal protein [Clostridia bacterium]|nr:uL15 family ribosomal protein [Clostridia bacterium]